MSRKEVKDGNEEFELSDRHSALEVRSASIAGASDIGVAAGHGAQTKSSPATSIELTLSIFPATERPKTTLAVATNQKTSTQDRLSDENKEIEWRLRIFTPEQEASYLQQRGKYEDLVLSRTLEIWYTHIGFSAEGEPIRVLKNFDKLAFHTDPKKEPKPIACYIYEAIVELSAFRADERPKMLQRARHLTE